MISSPCIQDCRLNAAGRVCLGCGRTVTEIVDWVHFSEKDRTRIMKRLAGSDGAGSKHPSKPDDLPVEET